MRENGHPEGTSPTLPETKGVRFPRYTRLRRNAIILTTLVALTPLAILTGVNYLQDAQAFRAETRYEVSRILSDTKRTLDFVIEERRSVLSLILSEHSFDGLASDAALKATLNNLKKSFGGFVDLGLILSDGNQIYYAGPYDLKNKNYRDQDWFHEVILREEYVSDVFLGYREIPHFVIAFKKEREDGDFYILRATLDMDLLTEQIQSLRLERNTEAFIVTQEGILQTSSRFYGDALEQVDFEVPPHIRSSGAVEERKDPSQLTMLGYDSVKNSPFILVVEKRQETPLRHWLTHRSRLLWYLAVSVVLILVVVVYFSNVTVKQLREADLRRAKIFHNIEYTNKMATIGRLASGVAHEINNPLAIINEKAGLLKDMASFQDGYPQKEKTLSLVDSILSSVDRCSRVTHRLLGFARRMDSKNELIDLRILLEEVVGFQTTEIAHRSISINYDIHPGLPSIESDRGQLQQVFLNIINNAIAAVKDGGKIDIGVQPASESTVAVTIRDDGTGIPSENMKYIFEPFFSTKGEFGTGLGLSITHDIVEKLGGRIDVESTYGVGTCFTVTLPMKRAEFGG